MRLDAILNRFDEALARPSAVTMQITGSQPRALLDEMLRRAKARGWFANEVRLEDETAKYPGLPIKYHVDEALKDWLRPPFANDKVLAAYAIRYREQKRPSLLVLDASNFPEEQRLPIVKQQIRDISNRAGEVALWIVFVVDPHTASLGPSTASEAELDVTLD
jgi:hypothetical protein